MRRPVDRFRVKLGAFYLQGEWGGWGALEHAASFTREQARVKVEQLRTKHGIKAEIVET